MRIERYTHFLPAIIGLFLLLGSACSEGRSLNEEGLFSQMDREELETPMLQDEDAPPVERYMPLNLGNSWTYDMKKPDSKGVMKVMIEKKQSGFFVDNLGGMLRLDARGLRDPRRYLIQAPIVRGATWQVQTSMTRREQFEIVDLHHAIDVPAGRFTDCLLVRCKSRIGPEIYEIMDFVYAPGVGMVQMKTSIVKGENPPETLAEMLLKAYQIP